MIRDTQTGAANNRKGYIMTEASTEMKERIRGTIQLLGTPDLAAMWETTEADSFLADILARDGQPRPRQARHLDRLSGRREILGRMPIIISLDLSVAM